MEGSFYMAENVIINSQEIRRLPAGSAFKAFFVVSSIVQKSDKNGKAYYDMTAADSFGTLEAKVWSDAQWLDKSTEHPLSADDRLAPEKIPALAGMTIGVNGKVSDFRGQLQYSFGKITLLNQEKFPPSAYLPHSPVPMEALAARLAALIEGCGGAAGDFIRKVFTGEFLHKFREWPAAVSHHHAYAGGLLEHTVSMAACAKSMAQEMAISGYDIDADIVVAGALLHDIGKLDSYRMTTVPNMTVEGALLDHVAQGYIRFCELAERYGLDEKTKIHLGHIILSHHGMREYGSPVVPATPEALVVSAADELDFKIFCWKDSVKNLTDEQPISPWNNSAQRRFWKK